MCSFPEVCSPGDLSKLVLSTVHFLCDLSILPQKFLTCRIDAVNNFLFVLLAKYIHKKCKRSEELQTTFQKRLNIYIIK